MKRGVFLGAGLLEALCCLALAPTDPAGGDWPMWGGTPERNMSSTMGGLPTSWDAEKQQNVKWTAKLGSPTYSTPVVARGQVYIGTTN